MESGPPSAARLPVPAAIFTDASDDLKNKLVKINYKYYKQTAESAALKTRANLRKMLQNCSIIYSTSKDNPNLIISSPVLLNRYSSLLSVLSISA